MPIQRKSRNIAIYVLINSKKEILLQYRDKNAPTFPHYWSFFGGGIEKDEKPIQAVKREAIEEVNYLLKKPKLIYVQAFRDKYQFGKKYVFIEKYQPSQKIKLKEGEDFGWYGFSKIKSLKMIPHDKILLNKIEKN